MTKVPWQTKSNKSGKQVFKASRPGQVVSVDQMISTQPGFVAQLKGLLTKQRYKAVTIFVDHFSGFRYVHMMYNCSSNETIKAKHAFEQLAANHNIRIDHYHANNGRFADNAFINNCNTQKQ
jgi:pyruvate/2-oxoacid:ferredoxin oxidoreductase beta subunit